MGVSLRRRPYQFRSDLLTSATNGHAQIAALHGYQTANAVAARLWEEIYPTHPSNELHTALPDTFTSDVFYKVRDTPPSRASSFIIYDLDFNLLQKYAFAGC